MLSAPNNYETREKLYEQCELAMSTGQDPDWTFRGTFLAVTLIQ